MSTPKELHHAAMILADEAVDARRQGRVEQARVLFKQAMAEEGRAADLTPPGPQTAITRAVLYRSAAALALDARCMEDAERLIAAGLAGDPPAEIEGELRELLWQLRIESRSASGIGVSQ